jgi:sulfur carrier protein
MNTNRCIQIFINQQAYRLEHPARLTDAIAAVQIKPPFAAAVNLQFVPKSQHACYELSEGDQVELIAPITGG